MGEKVDKGFCLIYWKLSYRRKFIRTLWGTPFVVIAVALILYLNPVSALSRFTPGILSIIIVAVHIIQLIYTYRKWKRGNIEKNSDGN